MADNEKKEKQDESVEKKSDNKDIKESEPKKDEPQDNTVDAKPNQTENGVNADIVNKLNSFKQEIIDYIDLKLASTPIAKVEKVENSEETKKSYPIW